MPVQVQTLRKWSTTDRRRSATCCRPSTRSGSPGRDHQHKHKHKLPLLLLPRTATIPRRWRRSNRRRILRRSWRRHVPAQVHQPCRTRRSPPVHRRPGPRPGRRLPRRGGGRARAAAGGAASRAGATRSPRRPPLESRAEEEEEVGSPGSPPPSSGRCPSCPSSAATTPATTTRATPAAAAGGCPWHSATGTTTPETIPPRPITGPSCTAPSADRRG